MKKVVFMFGDVVLAFTLVFAVSCLIYLVGRILSPRSDRTVNAQSSYACGEKSVLSKVRISVSLYKYIVYFVVVDSSVILIAFASIAGRTMDVLVFMLYLSIVLISGLLLIGGGD